MKWAVVLSVLTALIMAGLVAFAYVHGTDLRVLDPQGPIAFQERSVIFITLGLSAIVVIPLFIMLFYFALKYRASGSEANRRHEPNWDHDSWFAEAVWWFVPGVIIVLLGVLSWKTAHSLDPYQPIENGVAPITIQVIALDWKWLFVYPQEGIATVNMVEFPKDTPVHFEITSDAPMNSFWIPSLGGQIMAMPGMTTQLNLLADNVGDYNGFSANISGNGFAGMAFTARAVSEDDFTNWVQSVRGMSQPLDASSYAALAAPSEYNPIAYYSSVAGDIFNDNIMKYMMPAMQGDSMNDMQGMSMQLSP